MTRKSRRAAAAVIPAVAVQPPPPLPQPVTQSRSLPGILALILLIIVAYFPTLTAPYNWDDPIWVTTNPVVVAPGGIYSIWFVPRALQNYYPVVYTAFWLQYRIWQADPFYYHVVNILLQLANALLLWSIGKRLGLKAAWLGAALWAIHPVQVETVAWVAEQKNLLSTTLSMTAVLLFLKFMDRRAAAHPHAWRTYALATLLFILSMLSKTVTVTLPVIVLLLIWLRHGKISRPDWKALLPWFLLGGIMAPIAVWAERHQVGAVGAGLDFTFLQRNLMAAHALWFYLRTLLWPHPLILVYPKYNIDPHQWQPYLYVLAALLAAALLWLAQKRLGRGPLIAALLFFFLLLPAIGYVSFYTLLYSYVADHYQYTACAAILCLLAEGLLRAGARLKSAATVPPWLLALIPATTPIIALAVLLLFTLAAISNFQSRRYQNLVSIWGYTVENNPTSWIAQLDLGDSYNGQGQPDIALAHYQTAVALNPTEFRTHLSLARVLALLGRNTEAAEEYAKSLELTPSTTRVYTSNEIIESAASAAPPATESSAGLATLTIPTNPDALITQAQGLESQNNFAAAAQLYRQVLLARPKDAGIHYNLGNCLLQADQPAAAADQYRLATQLDPQKAEAFFNLGMALARLHQNADAFRALHHAVELNPALATQKQ